MADRRLVEVNAIGEAQGAVVAYVPDGGDRFNAWGAGCGWCIPWVPGDAGAAWGLPEPAAGRVPRWPEGWLKRR